MREKGRGDDRRNPGDLPAQNESFICQCKSTEAPPYLFLLRLCRGWPAVLCRKLATLPDKEDKDKEEEQEDVRGCRLREHSLWSRLLRYYSIGEHAPGFSSSPSCFSLSPLPSSSGFKWPLYFTGYIFPASSADSTFPSSAVWDIFNFIARYFHQVWIQVWKTRWGISRTIELIFSRLRVPFPNHCSTFLLPFFTKRRKF